MRLLGLLLVALLQSPTASVEGVAIKTGTTEAVAHALVMLTSVEGRLVDTRLVETDERGRFAFRGVADGTYRLVGQHDAFVRATGRVVTIASGQSIRDLVITMTPTGVITGRVVDEYGDPVADVYVRASLKDSVFETTTNDLGEYRLFGLPPGAYTVSAAPYLTPWIETETTLSNGIQTGRVVVPTRPSPFSPGEGRGMTPLAPVLRAGDFNPFMALRAESHATVYYPGTTDATAAAPIDVPAGAVVGAINFTTAVRRTVP
jgi:hypothetical protein